MCRDRIRGHVRTQLWCMGFEAAVKHPRVAVPKAGGLSERPVSFLCAEGSLFYYCVCLLGGKAFSRRAAIVSYALTRDLRWRLGDVGLNLELLPQGPSLHSLLPHPAPALTALLAGVPTSRPCVTLGPECLLLSEF